MAMLFFMVRKFKRAAHSPSGAATFGHFPPLARHQVITPSPVTRLEMAFRKAEVVAMSDDSRRDGTYAGAQFGTQPGERWRRFLERVGTRSNDFASRLARARFVYLHRRETASHWLPL
jgi:hypothetical protein